MNTFLVVVLNVGLAAVVYLVLARRIDRRLEPRKIVDNVRGEIEGIIVELNQTTDRNIGLIEDRVNQLNRLLQQADKRLSLLKREIESRSQSNDRYNDILTRARRGGGSSPASETKPPVAGGGHAAGDSSVAGGGPGAGDSSTAGRPSAGDGSSVPSVGGETGPGGSPASGNAAATGASMHGGPLPAESGREAREESRSGTVDRGARKQQIIELHRKGIAANIIANRTGTTVGEVELVISLSDKAPEGES
jgi:hypothetical protein